MAHGIGGLLGHDGRPPAELYELGRTELAEYPTVEVRTGEVTGGTTGNATLVVKASSDASQTGEEAIPFRYRKMIVPGGEEIE